MQTDKSPRNAIVINGVTYKAVLVNTMGVFAPYDLCALCDIRRRCKPDDKTSAASPPLQPWVKQTRFRRNLFENQ